MSQVKMPMVIAEQPEFCLVQPDWVVFLTLHTSTKAAC